MARQLKINLDDALGIGSYGKVVRAKLGKHPCAAKLLHDTMFMFDDPGQLTVIRKFREECELLSSIDHPNIVKYLGTAREPRSGRPVLLMELMYESLTKYLERSTAPLKYYSQFSIVHDVAVALAYLHANSVVHRDLSSNNVLLTVDGTAKVTDFGMSRLIAMHPRATPLTQCPGTLVYMPPEALMTPPQYSDRLDCFSFGVLIIQVATRQFPNPGESYKYVEDSRYPTGRIIVPIPEIERRKKQIDQIEPSHPLLFLAIKCIKDRDTERPSALELCEELAPLPEGERVKKEQQDREEKMRKVKEREKQERKESEESLTRKIKELKEQDKREEKQRRKKEKEIKRREKREAKAEAAKRKQLGQVSRYLTVDCIMTTLTSPPSPPQNDGSITWQTLYWPFSSKKKPRRFVEGGFDLDLTCKKRFLCTGGIDYI